MTGQKWESQAFPSFKHNSRKFFNVKLVQFSNPQFRRIAFVEICVWICIYLLSFLFNEESNDLEKKIVGRANHDTCFKEVYVFFCSASFVNDIKCKQLFSSIFCAPIHKKLHKITVAVDAGTFLICILGWMFVFCSLFRSWLWRCMWALYLLCLLFTFKIN